MLKIYSYIVDHDLGLAPNPFFGYCTLTVCKSQIRKSKNLNVGDWLIGTGSAKLEKRFGGKYIGKLIYAMEVNEVIPMELYWCDKRFNHKKPNVTGSLVKMYGDNIYYLDMQSNWRQLNSAHSNGDGSENIKNKLDDTGGQNALISTNFYYFGDKAPFIPENFKSLVFSTQGQKCFSGSIMIEFIQWLESSFDKGIIGLPINWKTYDQTNFLDKLF
jgi:hypothetical protein